MLRLILFFVIVAVLAVSAGWLADRPGVIAMEWQGYAIELSLMTAIILLITIIAFAIFLHSIYRIIVRGPELFGGYLKGRRRDRGYGALSRGMLAVGSGDIAAARKLSSEARRLLPNEPMTRLLEAQAAQASGRRDDAVASFNIMLESQDTKLLGLRGLFLEAQRDQNAEAARQYAEQAMSLAPGLPWAGNAMFDFQTGSGDWDGALRTLQVLNERKLVDKPMTRRRRAVLLTAKAIESESGEPEKALALALEAHGLAPDLVPAATTAARLSSRLGNVRRAAAVVEQTWRQNPHPELAEAYAHARPGDSVRDRYRRVKTLTQKAAHHAESRIALAAAAINAKDWQTARDTLMTLARTEPTVRICRLMAKVEEGEFGDRGRAREWLARSVNALPDPVWTADGRISEAWLPASPVTGKLDAFEWKVPIAAARPAIEAAIEALATPVADLAAPTAAPEEITATGPRDAPPNENTAPQASSTAAAAAEPPRDAEAAAGDSDQAPVSGEKKPDNAPAKTEAAPEADQVAAKDAKPAAGSDDASTKEEATKQTVEASRPNGAKAPPAGASVTPIRPPDDPGPGGGDIDEQDGGKAGKRIGPF